MPGARPYPTHVKSTHWLWTAAWVVLLAAFLALRLDASTDEHAMDERIVLSVSKGMSEAGRLDPNWTVASPHYYQYPQYNFYSYNILSHFLIAATAPLGAPPIVVLRIANLIYQLAALALLILALRKLEISAAPLFAAAALVTFLPGMVHDAHIARCESLLYLLFAAVIYCAVAGRFLMGGLLLGFGAAAKVTFLASSLVFVPYLVAARGAALRRSATLALATLAAFALAAPYAVAHFPVLVGGLARIRDIYLAHGAGPHRLIDPTPLRNALHAAAFLALVYGSLVPAALVVPLFHRGRLVLGVWLASVAVLGYFATVPFFIERNFSLALLGCAVLIGTWLAAGRGRILARVAFAAALVPMAYWSVQIGLAAHEHPGARQTQWEAAHIGRPVTYFWRGERNAAEELPRCSGALAIPDLNDDFSRRLLDRVRASGRTEIGHYVSRFSIVPTSTLHTYLDADVYYFSCTP